MAEELKEVQRSRPDPEKADLRKHDRGDGASPAGLLGRVDRIFSNLAACNTNPELQKIEKEMAPKMAAHADAIHLNSELFARVQTLYNDRDKLGLDPESNWLVERYYKDFVRAGAKLSDADKDEAESDERGIGGRCRPLSRKTC